MRFFRTATIVATVRRSHAFTSPRNPNLSILELQLEEMEATASEDEALATSFVEKLADYGAKRLKEDASGNPEIFVRDMATGRTDQITQHWSIDTEPVWAPDGRYIYFTSDRSGGPQVYRVSADGGSAERVTFEGSYNARPPVSPDGEKLAMVHLVNGNYRIAVMDLDRKDVLVLSAGRQDESPSFAPNSDTLIYATRTGRDGVLESVTADGLIRQRLKSGDGDVREPVWSPFQRF